MGTMTPCARGRLAAWLLIAVLSWVIYSFALFARKAIGWSGRRAAYLSGVAFAVVLLNFVLVGFFLTTSHNF